MEKSPRPAQLETTIREITQDLLQLTVTPHVRELRAKAVTYGRVIGNWATYSPTAPQVQAMLECVTELQEKVAEAKRDGNRDVSKITRKHGSEPAGRSNAGPPPLPSSIPLGVAWNATVPETSGVRSRKVASTPRNDAPTRPPPALSSAPPDAPSVPPLSAPRPVDNPTPIPALLRSRRSR